MENLEVMSIDKFFWKGKKVFLTGHTGFKGSWISLWLFSMGSIVKGFALNPITSNSLFNEAKIDSILQSNIGDVRDIKTLRESITSFNPDIVIHMAAQPLVRYSYENPVETYEINVMGTINLLEVARDCKNLKAILTITSDKCYENDGRISGYEESDNLGGHDPYSSSKGCVELLTSAYRRSFLNSQGIGVATARAGNVIGGGDWAKDRIIPDILRSFEKNKTVIVRNPEATRPWQHVLEPLSGYLILVQKLYVHNSEYSEGWNFGPNDKDVKSVRWILNNMAERLKGLDWRLEVDRTFHESELLKLNIDKSKARLNWSPIWGLHKTLDNIVKWHLAWKDKQDMQQACLTEIKEYVEDMNKKNNEEAN
jgi:CDP-glucose 4,6-dehydratase